MMADCTRPPNFWRQIAHLHQQEIREGFLSTLSVEFLARLYAAVVRSDKLFLLAAVDGSMDKVVAFICASTDTKSVLKQCIWQSGFRLIVPLLPRLLSGRTLAHLFESMRYASNGDATLPKAEILNFCVDGKSQGKGVGRRLFGSLISEFSRRGVHRIKIVTGESQVSAQLFYEAMQAYRVGTAEVHEGTKSVVFLYDINDTDRALT